ncbi:MAG: hypothetical protein AMJ65_01125 [Phycisphaerae bacterium SG8_4]|nr:MAG: hypothetical protein AMJ65_01125 [Phycisphaerae bacterium SG8_4]
MNPADSIERRIEQLHISTGAETDKRILDDSFAALGVGLLQPQGGIRRLIFGSRIAGPVAAAAAVTLVAAVLLVSLPQRGSDTVEEFYRTLSGAENVCVSTFAAGQTSPQQQVWTSHSLNVRLFKTGSGDQARFALWDVPSKVQMTMYLSEFQTEPLTEERLAEIEKSLASLSGVTPFADVKDVPKRARWSRVKDPAAVAVISGCAVYDLEWLQQGTISEVGTYRRWRVFVDAKTHLPRRAESYAKSESEQEYALEYFIMVTYPSESEIQDIVAGTFGPPSSRTGGPEYIGTPGMDR